MLVNVDVGAIAAAVVALCTLGNTAMLIWHSRQLLQVKSATNGALAAAKDASEQAGYVRGVIASTRPPSRGYPPQVVGESPTDKSGSFPSPTFPP